MKQIPCKYCEKPHCTKGNGCKFGHPVRYGKCTFCGK